MVAGDHARAAAVEAGALAERAVHVERERPRNRLFIAVAHVLAVLGLTEVFAEARGGRVGRVARTGDVVTREELGVEFDGSVRVRSHHGASLWLADGDRLD